MKALLVIGASGYVGRAIVDKAGPEVPLVLTHCHSNPAEDSVAFDLFRNHIANKVPVGEVGGVIFAAMVEDRRRADVKKAMTRFAKALSRTRMVYLSSDAVFSGRRGHYSEKDACDAQSVYGRNLFCCETIIRQCCPNHCIIRPSYLYGFSGGRLDKRLSATQENLLRRRRVSLFGDMYKSPLGVQQFAEAVLKLSASGYVGTVHVAGQRTSVFDFHRTAMAALGVATKNLQAVAMPKNGGLPKDTSLDISKWKRIAKMEPLSIRATLT